MKLFENGLTKGSKITAAVVYGLFALSVIATLGLGFIIGGFGLADTIPVWLTMTPLALFVTVLVLAIVGVVITMIIDMIINNNVAEYLELLNPFSKSTVTEEESDFANHIFEGNDYAGQK